MMALWLPPGLPVPAFDRVPLPARPKCNVPPPTLNSTFTCQWQACLDGPAVLTLPSLAADVAATAEAAGALLTSLGWGYTQGVVDATIGGDAAFAIGSGAGAPQVCAIVTGRAAGTQVCAMKGL